MNFTLRELIFGVLAAGALVGAIVQSIYLEKITQQRYELKAQEDEFARRREEARMRRYYQFKLKEAGVPYKPEDDDPKKASEWKEELPGYEHWRAERFQSTGDIWFGSGNVLIGYPWALAAVIDYPLGPPDEGLK